jgi:ABC-type polar amino acid transport system ATPase subunit
MNDVASSSMPAAVVELRGLSISAGGRVLLREASVRFRPGGIALIVGCSGVGKSLLLRVMAGLVERQERGIHVAGEVAIHRPGADGEATPPVRASVGVVFQHFALFDEWKPLDNVRFAYAHRGRPRNNSPQPQELLDELRVPASTPTAVLSGGQKQRLAIARTRLRSGCDPVRRADLRTRCSHRRSSGRADPRRARRARQNLDHRHARF